MSSTDNHLIALVRFDIVVCQAGSVNDIVHICGKDWFWERMAWSGQ